jgi:hypothetical protein
MELSLKDFWPSLEHCNECLATEAEAVDDAVFLAVHQPMRLFRRRLKEQAELEKKEETDLLEALLTKNPASGTLLVPIVGSSGVGKSHMIRWLGAQLRNRKDDVSRHIVRIPKSASMKRVLELILEDLPKESYGALHLKLTTARMPPDLLTATFSLLARVLVALERSYQQARARIEEGKELPNDRERMTHCDPRGLPALLQENEIRSHFIAYEGTSKGVLARIAERYMQGTPAVEGPANQFTEADLILDEKLDRSLLSHAARSYLVNLNLQDGKARKAAVAILNDVVDPALGELRDFGGNSLTELFVKIREKLLEDGKELVLLVEDFAALAGIQGSLLDAMIFHGIDAGRQKLCVMRTALAVTEGYLANRQTVLTRAVYEWRIEERPFANDDEAIATFTNFVGGYLNAARWGKTRLQKEFKKRAKGASDLQDWLPNFYDQRQDDLDPESAVALKEFGFSSRGHHPLFPFNQGVIHQLARRHLREGNTFVLNPRELLNLVLRETLITNRRLFDAASFPPGNFQQFTRNKLALPVSRELTHRADSEQVDRLAALIFHWGNDPQTPGEAAGLSEAIYRAFKLPPVKWSEAWVPPTRPVPVAPVNTGVPVPAPPDPWTQKLQNWRENGVISQADANKVRKFLCDAVAQWIDWEALLVESVSLDHTRIVLPKVAIGNPTATNTMAVAITDEELKDESRADQFFSALTAVIRFHGGDRSWNYDGGEADSAAYANLIHHMAGQAEDWLRRQAHALPREGIRPLAQALLIGARLLGLEGASVNTDADNLAALFASAPPEDDAVPDTDDHWSRLRSGARRFRVEAKELLLRLVAARQGTGDTVQAIDSTELLAAIRELRSSWLLPTELNPKLFDYHPLLKQHLSDLKNLLKNAVTQRSAALGQWRREIDEWVGPDFDVRVLVDEMKKTALAAQQAHVFRGAGITYDSLRDALNKLPECRLKETLEFGQKATEAKDFGVVLSALAQADPRVEETSRRILKQYAMFLQETTEVADDKLATAPPSVADEGKRRALEVEALEKLWQEVEAIR